MDSTQQTFGSLGDVVERLVVMVTPRYFTSEHGWRVCPFREMVSAGRFLDLEIGMS